jgi:sterol desaturase/sphingolipid hydroxylase (fatty acid hydroxylase superfamily)
MEVSRLVAEIFSFDVDSWSFFPHYLAFTMLLIPSMQLQNHITGRVRAIWCGGRPFRYPEIAFKAKEYKDSELTFVDHAYVFINCILTAPYIVWTVKHLRATDAIEWSWRPSLLLGPLQFFALFALYDAIYVPFHRALHTPTLYPWIHKHHHRQASPFRGTWDGINTHPLEFLFGSNLHLWSIMLLEGLMHLMSSHVSELIPSQVHCVPVFLFLLASGFEASLNHTRWGVRIPFFFDVRDHDVHHRYPRSNYGQFVMWWDHLYGSYRPYEESSK